MYIEYGKHYFVYTIFIYCETKIQTKLTFKSLQQMSILTNTHRTFSKIKTKKSSISYQFRLFQLIKSWFLKIVTFRIKYETFSLSALLKKTYKIKILAYSKLFMKPSDFRGYWIKFMKISYTPLSS